MTDSVPMVTACLDGQSKQYHCGRCNVCDAPMDHARATTSGFWGLCALCAIRVELGELPAPAPSWWDLS